MLQTIYNKNRTSAASSLYCVWTTRDGLPGSPLVAVWIDPTLASFEVEFPPSATQLLAEEECPDEPGGYPPSAPRLQFVPR